VIRRSVDPSIHRSSDPSIQRSVRNSYNAILPLPRIETDSLAARFLFMPLVYMAVVDND